MAHEVCDQCQTQFDLDADNTQAFLFLRDEICNHVVTVCPNCGFKTRIFLTAENFIGLIDECLIRPDTYLTAVDQLREMAYSMWGEVSPTAEADPTDDLPAAPREWLMQLYDDLRNWRGVIE